MTTSWAARIGLAGALMAATALSSSGQLLKWGGTTGLVIYALLVFAIALLATTPLLDRLFANRRVILALWAALIIAAVAVFVVMYPLAHSGRLGPGTDRDEALNLALRALLHGGYPYYPVTRFGAPITPLPGALLLALPFYVLGNAAFQVLLWAPLFLLFCRRALPSQKQALLFAGLCVLANLSFLQDYVSGGDYSINIFYFTMALVFLQARLGRDAAWAELVLPVLLLGVALASRPVWCLALPVLFLQSRAHWIKGAAVCALALAVMLLLSAPFYFYDPPHFSPLHIVGFASSAIPHAAVLLPGLALAATLLALVVAPNRFSLFGVTALALCFLFLPSVIFNFGVFNGTVVNWLGYCYPLTVWGGFWLASRPAFAPGLAATAPPG